MWLTKASIYCHKHENIIFGWCFLIFLFYEIIVLTMNENYDQVYLKIPCKMVTGIFYFWAMCFFFFLILYFFVCISIDMFYHTSLDIIFGSIRLDVNSAILFIDFTQKNCVLPSFSFLFFFLNFRKCRISFIVLLFIWMHSILPSFSHACERQFLFESLTFFKCHNLKQIYIL